MRVFIDTEFTNLDSGPMKLISMALISQNGQVLYAELPVKIGDCSDFVLQMVLPLLSGSANVQCGSLEELGSRIIGWIEELNQSEVVVCYDSNLDWNWFIRALNSRLPKNVRGENISQQINAKKYESYFQINSVMEHHAVNDAKANMFAFEE